MMWQHVETKVIAAASGGGAGGVVATFVLWLLGVTVWSVPFDAGHAEAAVAAVPGLVAALVSLILSLAGAAIAGYLAPHTSRPDLKESVHVAVPEAAQADPSRYNPTYGLHPDKA